MTVKFSQFFNGGILTTGDDPVGLQNGVNAIFTDNGSGGNGSSLISLITQTAHGFLVNQVVYNNNGVWTLAQADSAADAEVIGIVVSIVDVNNFNVLTSGLILTLTGLIPGAVYFLSDTVAGGITLNEPVTIGFISKPLIIASSATQAFFYNFRGKIVPSPAVPVLFWNAIAVDTIMVANNGYYTTGGGTLNLTLPTIIPAGQIIRIAGFESTGWKIVQNSGQQVSVGNKATTSGATGYLASTTMTDCVEILCTTANVNFVVISSMGNITFN